MDYTFGKGWVRIEGIDAWLILYIRKHVKNIILHNMQNNPS